MLVLNCKPLGFQSCVWCDYIYCIHMYASGIERWVGGLASCKGIKFVVGKGRVYKSSPMQERGQTAKQQHYSTTHCYICTSSVQYTAVCIVFTV